MKILAGVSVLLMLTGCVTAVRGTKQPFEIVSEPAGAAVSLSNGMTCVTPCRLKLDRKAGFVATIAKAGYASQQVTVASVVHDHGLAIDAGSALAGGMIGLLVDRGSGTLRDLRPSPIAVTLTPDTHQP